MNKVILIGRLTADPDVTTTANGSTITKYTLAVNRTYKKEGQPDADFPRCTCFGASAEFAANYLVKGSKIAVEGRIQTGSYEKDGVKHYTTDVIVDRHEFCESKRSSDSSQSTSLPADPLDRVTSFDIVDVDDGDLPF